ncbi:hypothetical protein P154DRAFT_619613 [Amniculicola lignicola CBS 123094]|uniref:Uncharacterized protein n=1 Tax=Amniculicola lignicola CBS 123094 TaxID=1392246 RepID=A0A6A5WIN0_9PLEO|nr:hypothetical protein P154DRAFT_619613 [Amniculicola lignicola CBS 123094]
MERRVNVPMRPLTLISRLQGEALTIMTFDMSNRLLCPIIDIETGVSAPTHPCPAPDTQESAQIQPDGAATILLSACSELVTETVPLNTFNGTHKVKLCQDASAMPMVFTMGTDDKLYSLVQVDNSPLGWEVLDLTPPTAKDGKIITFDVIERPFKKLALAVAHEVLDGAILVGHSLISTPSFAWDSSSRTVVGLQLPVPWTYVQNNLSPKTVFSLSLVPAINEAGFQIMVGTAATDIRVGAHFSVDPSPSAQQPWKEVPTPENAQTMIDVIPGKVSQGAGIFTLYERPNHTKGCTFDAESGRFHFNIQLETIGTACSIHANRNPWNMTDLFVAGSDGIGYYPFSRLDKSPQIILSGRSFKQVVCSEIPDPVFAATRTRATIFAIDSDNQLYYILGHRAYATNKFTFDASGIPIRTNVAEVSAIFSTVMSTTEVICLGDGTNEMFHMRLDATPISWRVDPIFVRKQATITKYAAYATALTFTKNDGTSIGPNYPVKVTCSSVQASVNGRSRSLGPMLSVLRTGLDGRIRIVVPTDETFIGPTYTIQLYLLTSSPRSFQVQSTQRVLRVIGNIQSSDDILGSITTDGRAVFEESTREMGDASEILSHFPSMLQAVDGQAAQHCLDAQTKPSKGDATFAYFRDENGNVHRNVGDWITDAVETVEHFFADVLRFIRNTVKTVVKIAIRILGKVVSFVFHIAGQVFKFVLREVGQLLTSTIAFLRDHLNLDMDKLLDWISFIFDQEDAQKTQTVLVQFATNSKDPTKSRLLEGKDFMAANVKKMQDALQSTVHDHRAPISKDPSGLLDALKEPLKVLKCIASNPIAALWDKFNPINILMNIVMEAIEEELPGFQPTLPPAVSKLLDVIKNLLEDEGENIVCLLMDIKDKLWVAVQDPNQLGRSLFELLGDSLWTLFDALKVLLFAAMEIIVAVIDLIWDVLSAEWHLGFISEMWKDFTGTPMTLLNLVTWLGAHFMNLVSLILFERLPFEVAGDPNTLFQKLATSPRKFLRSADGPQRKPVASEKGFMEAEPKVEHMSEYTYNQIMAWTTLSSQFAASGATLCSFIEICGTDAAAEAAKNASKDISKGSFMNDMKLASSVGASPLVVFLKVASGRFLAGLTWTQILQFLFDFIEQSAVAKASDFINWFSLAVGIADTATRVVFTVIPEANPKIKTITDVTNTLVCVFGLAEICLSEVMDDEKTSRTRDAVLIASSVFSTAGSAITTYEKFTSDYNPYLFGANGVCQAFDHVLGMTALAMIIAQAMNESNRK